MDSRLPTATKEIDFPLLATPHLDFPLLANCGHVHLVAPESPHALSTCYPIPGLGLPIPTLDFHSPFSILQSPASDGDGRRGAGHKQGVDRVASARGGFKVAVGRSRPSISRRLHVMGVCGTCFLTLRKTAGGRHTWRCHEQAPALLQIPLASRCVQYHCASFRLGNRCPRDLLARVLMDGCARPPSRTW